MGTRSLTNIYEDEKVLLTFYRQFDGYPSGHGKELAELLDGFKIVNGISESRPKLANGMGCLAAQIVKHFKEDVGGVYIYPANAKDCGEEFVYHVKGEAGNPLLIEVRECDNTLVCKGTPAQVLKAIKKIK